MVAPSKYNAYIVEFDGSGEPPPLLPPSQDDLCSFSCTLIEQMILYLSVIAFIKIPQTLSQVISYK